MKKFVLSSFFLLTLALEISATPGDFLVSRDISYTNSSDAYARERARLDVYHPCDTTQRLPVVVWFHGGGLTAGSKEIPAQLQDAGLVVVAPNYRLLPQAGAIDSCLTDAAQAIAWTMRNIQHFGGDPGNIYLSGHSAGGYLVAMVGLDKEWLVPMGLDPDSVTAIVPFSGQMITHFAQRQQLGIGNLQPTIDRYAPLYHVRADAPPVILITGDPEMELFGRHEENLYMWRMLKLVGHPSVEIYRLDGHDHGDMAQPAFHILKSVIQRYSNPNKEPKRH